MNYTTQVGSGGAEWVGRKILIIEDSHELAHVIRKWCALLGADVTVLSTGGDAFRGLLTADFDAIICDVSMSRLPAEMLYVAVGKMKPHLLTRFVFLLGYGEKDDVAGFLWQYCGPTVPMPLCLDRLTEAVESLLPTPTIDPRQVFQLAAA